MTKEQLKAEVKRLEECIAAINNEIRAIDALPENNVYVSVDSAEDYICEAIWDEATKDCDGRYCRGADQYTREFIVGEQHFIATVDVEYNRHDKTYYYVDGLEFSCELKGE